MKKIVNIFVGVDCRKYCDILNNDEWFQANVLSDKTFLKQAKKLIEKLDKSKFDVSSMTLQNDYDVCDIKNLATGIKCLLNCMYVKDEDKQYAIFFDAGDSLFPLICKVIANTKIFLCVTRDCLIMPEEYTYKVNGEVLEDVLDFIDLLDVHSQDVIDFSKFK